MSLVRVVCLVDSEYRLSMDYVCGDGFYTRSHPKEEEEKRHAISKDLDLYLFFSASPLLFLLLLLFFSSSGMGT